MLRVQRGEGCSVIHELVASFKPGKRKVNVGDAWFRVSLLSVCLSVSQLEFLSADRRLSSLDLCPHSRNLSFISFSSSDRIRLGFLCFLLRRLRTGRKITFNYFYFLTNFIDISLCAETPFINSEESLTTDNIRWVNALVDAS